MDCSAYLLGLADYARAWELQEQLLADTIAGKSHASLIVCSHYPVITAGRRFEPGNMLVDESTLAQKGIAFYRAQRGGDITYHGPGQLTAYPVINLADFTRDIGRYLRTLESAVISFSKSLGAPEALRRDGFTGVWARGKKFCSIGIALKHWVSFHGLSINIKKDDLENFSLIRPCGMDIEMTCLEELCKKELSVRDLARPFIEHFMKAFENSGYPASLSRR
ncbi:MAG: lipoyl(octanoyl) transferase LipB [Candidatus Omnitrophica bacterium]|nr:lipoyl(octanoyl) transferase LipB [Candidatus Omnitrophota bacterium]